MLNKHHHAKILIGLILLTCYFIDGQANTRINSEESKIQNFINQWVEMWNNYDLDQVERLFLKSDRLSYFSSEKEGVIRGFAKVLKHHMEFGFVRGGKKSPNRLWLEQVNIFDSESYAIATAIWYFKKAGGPPQRGPVTFVCRKSAQGYKFVHLTFGNYKQETEGAKEILVVVQSFFDVIETRNMQLAKHILIPGGVYFSIRGKGKKQVLRSQTHEQFMKNISSVTKRYKEVMHDPQVLIHRGIAMVWTKYSFYVGGKLSHTGIDSFSLIKVKDRWQIATAVYTVEAN